MRAAPPGSASRAERRAAGRRRPPAGLVLAVLALHVLLLLAWTPPPAGPALQRFELPDWTALSLATAPPPPIPPPAAAPPAAPDARPAPPAAAASAPRPPARKPAPPAEAASAPGPDAPDSAAVRADVAAPGPEPAASAGLPAPDAGRAPAPAVAEAASGPPAGRQPGEGPGAAPAFLAGPASAPASAAAPAGLAAAEPDDGAEPAWLAPWPPAVELRYRLQGDVRGEIHGEATVRWLRQGRRYQVHVDVLVGPRFAALLDRRSTSEGRIGPEGLVPERYEERNKLPLVAERRAQLRFEPGQVVLANGKVEAAPPGLQDPASQFVQMAWRLAQGEAGWQAGQWLEMPLALPRRVERLRFELVARVAVPTPFGELPAWHVRPERRGRAAAYTMEAWLAPALRGLPVRIHLQDDKGQRLDLELESLPRAALDPEALARAAAQPAPPPATLPPRPAPSLPPGFQP